MLRKARAEMPLTLVDYERLAKRSRSQAHVLMLEVRGFVDVGSHASGCLPPIPCLVSNRAEFSPFDLFEKDARGEKIHDAKTSILVPQLPIVFDRFIPMLLIRCTACSEFFPPSIMRRRNARHP